MNEKVDDIVHDAWPPDQWHPAYESFSEWLDSEAPAEPGTIKAAKKANAAKRIFRRRI